jgi:hypothetical protein
MNRGLFKQVGGRMVVRVDMFANSHRGSVKSQRWI